MPATPPPWHPEAFARRRPHLAVRGRVLGALRRVFKENAFVEVDTPALQVSPGMEPHLQAFATDLQGPHPDDRRRLYLHTSPEFAMKKLLVAGVPRLYQIAHVYRNGERSGTHSPEFSMLEWYRAGEGYKTLIQDCEDLVRAAAVAAGRSRFDFRGMTCDPFKAWRVLTVQDAFLDYAGIDLLATFDGSHDPDPTALAAEAERIGVHPHAGDRWEDIVFRIMFDRIEPHLGEGVPCVLTDYPVCMAALSRPKPEDPRLAERFELYACGLELANAFGELTDAAAQRARFEADMDLKQRLYGERFPVDEDFLAALEHGMPESSGIALGFDRLVMLCSGAESIDDVLWLPVAR
ncbi:EF-P lysine aminoacylase EpmA [Azospirillum rugosum]|uniref:Lysyl-tRNA synthetase class 2 n=1 Tax=Azospirillum rugosum TaxID=416170 RepID=A0ABS4SH76_9PROT|nr:EF-P lysine aminoacylase EpmA [Azospirillum rugosum]MBP2291929.1 lysyl-tRNA synthetase class 2 [Azospirillum rugosum]MDQ0525935.1 lysyl-tRNA synthetase class 2 [Azospirillum rugosum]